MLFPISFLQKKDLQAVRCQFRADWVQVVVAHLAVTVAVIVVLPVPQSLQIQNQVSSSTCKSCTISFNNHLEYSGMGQHMETWNTGCGFSRVYGHCVFNAYTHLTAKWPSVGEWSTLQVKLHAFSGVHLH